MGLGSSSNGTEMKAISSSSSCTCSCPAKILSSSLYEPGDMNMAMSVLSSEGGRFASPTQSVAHFAKIMKTR